MSYSYGNLPMRLTQINHCDIIKTSGDVDMFRGFVTEDKMATMYPCDQCSLFYDDCGTMWRRLPCGHSQCDVVHAQLVDDPDFCYVCYDIQIEREDHSRYDYEDAEEAAV